MRIPHLRPQLNDEQHEFRSNFVIENRTIRARHCLFPACFVNRFRSRLFDTQHTHTLQIVPRSGGVWRSCALHLPIERL